ncbi:MAG: hypothetical protein ACH350_02420 [Parachlamydiaceae bacterium]
MVTVLTRLIKPFLVLLILFLVLIGFLPSIVSTDWGQKKIVAWINQTIPGHVDIRNFSLHWNQGQVIEGGVLKSRQGETILSFERLSTEATLWQLIRKNFNIGFTEVSDLNAVIAIDQNGHTNLENALGIPKQIPSLLFPQDPIILSQFNAQGNLFSPYHPLSLLMKGITQQGDLYGTVDIDVSLNEENLSESQEVEKKSETDISSQMLKKGKLSVNITHFPANLICFLIQSCNNKLNDLTHCLIGGYFDLKLEKETESKHSELNLTLATPQMNGQMKGVIKDGVFSLINPTHFYLELTPESINSLFSPRFHLLSPSKIDFLIHNLSIPLHYFNQREETLSCQFGFNTELKITESHLHLQSLGDIDIFNLSSHLFSEPCDQLIHLDLFGKATNGEEPFEFSVSSSVNKGKKYTDLIEQIPHTIRSTFAISQFPLQFLPFLRLQPELNEMIGSYVDAQINVQPKNKGKWLGTFSLSTPNLVLKEAQFSLDNDISLISEAKVDWTFSSNCLKTLLKQDNLDLEDSCHFHFFLKHLHIPLNTPLLTTFEVDFPISDLPLANSGNLGKIQIEDFNMKLKGKNLFDISSHIKGKVSLKSLTATPSPLIPDPLIVNLDAKWKIEREGLIEMSEGDLQIENSITKVALKGAIDSRHLFKLKEPVKIHYMLSPLALEALGKNFNQIFPKIRESTALDMTIEPTQFDLNAHSFSDLYMQGILHINKMMLEDSSKNDPILDEMNISWVMDAPGNNLYANIKGVAYTVKDPKESQISAYMQLGVDYKHFSFLNTPSEIRMNFFGLPTSILNLLFKTPDLNPIIGSILDVNLKFYFDPTKDKPGYLDIVMDSTYFHAACQLKLSHNLTLYNPAKPPNFRITLTPDSFKQIKKCLNIDNCHDLSTPFTITGTVTDLNFLLNKKWTNQGAFDFNVTTTDIEWKNKSTHPWKFIGRLSTQDLSEKINFSAQIESETSLKMSGSLFHLFDTMNHLHDWQQIGLEAKINGHEIAPAFFHNCSSLTSDQEKQLQILLGDRFDISAHLQTRGLDSSIQSSIKGSNGAIELDGKINHGVLTLNTPLKGSFTITPRFIQTFIKPNAPLLSTAIGAETPISFTVEPSQFSCPLNPFELETLNIQKGLLNLGKIHFRNEGELQSLLSLIAPFSGQDFTIWFTPIYFELNKGVLFLKRFDMLVAKAYTLANWGSINLKTQEADFVLGITTPTLRHIFNIEGLDDAYILQIPLHTGKGKVEIDKKKVTARISALIAQTHGGEKGRWLGGFLDMILSEKAEAYPPATTIPFPWTNEFHSSNKGESKSIEIKRPSEQKSKEKNQKKKKRENAPLNSIS